MAGIENFVAEASSILWGWSLIIILCGTGIYFTVRLGFVNVVKFGDGIKGVFGDIRLFGGDADEGGISSFQALATAISAQIGTGNLAGGVLGAGIKEAIRYGVARGLFSNEAGMGSTPHAHAVAKVDHPCEQGVAAMIGVFIDTFIVLTLTALVVVIYMLKNVTPETVIADFPSGINLAQAAFSSALGSFGNMFIAVCLLFFAFTTIVGWYLFGEANVKYLFGKKAVPVYAVLVLVFVLLGSFLHNDFVWNLADLFNGLMVIPNLIGLIGLSAVVSRLYNDYCNRK